jgi:hypothetical protein
MKAEARTIDLGDVLVVGRTRHEVIGVYYNSGGLGDSVRFDLRNVKTGRIRQSNVFDHECLLEVVGVVLHNTYRP